MLLQCGIQWRRIWHGGVRSYPLWESGGARGGTEMGIKLYLMAKCSKWI